MAWPENMVAMIMSYVPPDPSDGRDKAKWKGSKHSSCSTANVYKIIKKERDDPNRGLWKQIWKVKLQQCLKMLLRRIAQDNLLTKKLLSARGLGSDICHLFNSAPESTLHALRDFKSSREVWIKCIPLDAHNHFFNSCSMFWQWRNQALFEDEFVPPENPTNFMSTCAFQNWTTATSLSNDVMTQMTPPKVYWDLPPPNWIKLNIDGSAYDNP
ncbi:ribonuclease H [Senna tora]|uniref:Ribonuclease H n=1 Tax=Senna tora TaxID=362788 RepID=A0A834WM88_9FABA|nr:ribonuclease H [Senna tora]